MVIRRFDHDFSICKTEDFSQVNFHASFCFTGRTDEEYSLVCLTQDVPGNVTVCDDGWKAMRIEGILDFSLTGILAGIAGILAQQKIGLFAVSTFNTDYVLTKAENFDRALFALAEAGYTITG